MAAVGGSREGEFGKGEIGGEGGGEEGFLNEERGEWRVVYFLFYLVLSY